MGLDWIVTPKRVKNDVDLGLITKRIEDIKNDLDERFKNFCESLGHEIPFVYPNPVTDDFNALDATKETRSELDKLQAEHDKHFISPAQTIGAPRIGEDQRADDWVKNNWEYLRTTKEDGTQMTFHEFTTAHFGEYVVEAVDSPGIGQVTGIMCSPTSFRGKLVGRCGWLCNDLQSRAYEDMDPDDLVEYGEDLKRAASSQEASNEDDKRYVELIDAAGDWCIFWGKKGHGMHAWY